MTAVKYGRPPEIEAALVALPPPTGSGYVDRLRAVPLEVVVIARRGAGDRRLRDQIDGILVDRVSPRIRAAVRRQVSPSYHDIDEVEDEAMVLFWESLSRESFFEVRFNLAMKRIVQHAAHHLRGGKKCEGERTATRIGPIDPEGSEGRGARLDVADDADSYAAGDDRLLIEAGLATLPEEQGRALSLHYLIGLPVHSQDPAVQTVASTLGCGERKARQLIADGLASLRRWIDGEGGDE